MSKEKIIVVVDIQKRYGYSFNYDYLNKVASYLTKEKANGIKIITMIEPIHEVGEYEDQIVFDLVPQFILDVSEDIDYKYFYKKLLDSVSKNKRDIKLDNKIYSVYMSRILQKLCDFPKEAVFFELLGGSYSYCVYTVYHLLNQSGFEVICNKDMCYEFSKNPKDIVNVFDESLPSYIEKNLEQNNESLKLSSFNSKDEDFIQLLKDLVKESRPKPSEEELKRKEEELKRKEEFRNLGFL